MARGDTHREPRHAYKDPVTGREVVRLTGLDHSCHHPYFYYRAFTPDGRRLLYISDRTGRRNLFLLDIETGESVQLTACRQLSDFCLELTADGRAVIYCEAQQLRRLDLGTLRETTLYVQEHPWDGHSVYPGFSEDGSEALLAQIHAEDVIEAREGWDAFLPQFLARPRCRLTLVDLATGAERVVLEERCWLGHPQIRPRDHSLLMYCHEGPGDRIDARMWLIRADGTQNRCAGHHRLHPGPDGGGIVTHEYFTADGRFIGFACFPQGWGEGQSLRLIEVETLREQILGATQNYCHLIHSADLRFVAGDETNRRHRDRACIWLFESASRRERPLCRHGSSYACRINRDTGRPSTQDCHPHVAFSPDGSRVVFTSDMDTSPTGNCAVYLASTERVFD